MSKIPKAIQRTAALSLAYKNVFESPDGQIVLADLCARGGLLEAVAGETNDVLLSNGRRSIVLEILAQIRFDVPKLLELTQRRLDEIGDEE